MRKDNTSTGLGIPGTSGSYPSFKYIIFSQVVFMRVTHTCIIRGIMAELTLTDGAITIIDDEDHEYLRKFKWHLNKAGYVVCHISKYKHIWMHRIVNKTPEDYVTDHIDGNKLDNRKSNLRTATRYLNGLNCKKPTHNTSGVKGVYWDKNAKKWHAQIKIKGKQTHIGLFVSIDDAAAAYNFMLIKRMEDELWYTNHNREKQSEQSHK